MKKELRTVNGIPMIANEAKKFNGMVFALSPYNGQPTVYILIRDGIAHSCAASTDADVKKLQYDKHYGYVKTRLSHGETDYTMYISEADNKVFIYNAEDFHVGASLAGIGIKTMDLPIENIPLSMFENNADDLKKAFETINAMTDIVNGDTCRLLHRELIEFRKKHTRTPFIMRVFQAPEFIADVGAKCWIRRNRGNHGGGNERKDIEFIRLPDEGISSSAALDGLRMSCIGIDGEYRLLSSWTGGGTVWLDGDAAFIKINEDCFIYTGEPNVEIPTLSKVTLKNAALRRSLRMGENPTVIVDGDSSITVDSFDSCVNCLGEVTITGRGTLALSCKTHSAAIGCGGESQSYGRYVPSRSANPITKVIVDGVHLEVDSGTPNFSIGAYGRDNNVEIVLLNGGTVNGVPEAVGKVRLNSVGTMYNGSTKIEGSAVYILSPAEETPSYKISADPYAAPGESAN